MPRELLRMVLNTHFQFLNTVQNMRIEKYDCETISYCADSENDSAENSEICMGNYFL